MSTRSHKTRRKGGMNGYQKLALNALLTGAVLASNRKKKHTRRGRRSRPGRGELLQSRKVGGRGRRRGRGRGGWEPFSYTDNGIYEKDPRSVGGPMAPKSRSQDDWDGVGWGGSGGGVGWGGSGLFKSGGRKHRYRNRSRRRASRGGDLLGEGERIPDGKDGNGEWRDGKWYPNPWPSEEDQFEHLSRI